MIDPIKIPRGVAKIFMIGQISVTNAIENNHHRPDLILGSSSFSPMKQELMNNFLSNTSPISFSKGKSYAIADNAFYNMFGAF